MRTLNGWRWLLPSPSQQARPLRRFYSPPLRSRLAISRRQRRDLDDQPSIEAFPYLTDNQMPALDCVPANGQIPVRASPSASSGPSSAQLQSLCCCGQFPAKARSHNRCSPRGSGARPHPFRKNGGKAGASGAGVIPWRRDSSPGGGRVQSRQDVEAGRTRIAGRKPRCRQRR